MVSKLKLQLSRGFTIVELLVVVVVIGVLAAITIVSYTGISSKATVATLTSDLTNASKLLKMDQIINGIFPASLAVANSGKGIPASPGTTFEYSVDNISNPQRFCIASTKGTTSYRQTNDGTPSPGNCNNFGLVLSLDAGNIVSYPGSGTNWNDLSGLNNNGTLINHVQYIADGGGSMSFDGVDDYVNLSTLNTSVLSNCSASFWRKSPNSNKWLVLGGQSSTYYLMAVSTGNFYHSNAGSPILIYEDGVNVVKDARDGIWHNYVATGVNLSAWTALYLSNYSTYQYNGQLSEIKIHNRTLSIAEIQQNFNSTKARYGL